MSHERSIKQDGPAIRSKWAPLRDEIRATAPVPHTGILRVSILAVLDNGVDNRYTHAYFVQPSWYHVQVRVGNSTLHTFPATSTQEPPSRARCAHIRQQGMAMCVEPYAEAFGIALEAAMLEAHTQIVALAAAYCAKVPKEA